MSNHSMQKLTSLVYTGVLSLLAFNVYADAVSSADFILNNGEFYTVNEQQPWVQAVAIKDGKIIYVGDDSGAESYKGKQTLTYNLEKQFVLPGLVDSHTHPGYIAADTETVELPYYGNKEQVLNTLAAYAKKYPEKPFIYGGSWPNTLFDDRGPHKSELDAVINDRPVLLIDTSGHSQWLNSKALELFGIDKNTVDPVPGVSFFYRDANGEPTGWVKEFAIREQMQAIGMRGVVDAKVFEQFLNYLSSMGVTTLFDGGNNGPGDSAYSIASDLESKGRLPVRYEGVYHITLPKQVPIAIDELKRLRQDYGGKRLKFNTIKIHFDGVHEVATSGVIEPFINTNDNNRGGTLMNTEELSDFIFELHQESIDLHMHTVGDYAVKVALDAVEATQSIIKEPLRTQVTLCHLELIAEEDFKRFRELGVIANYTPHWHGGWIDGAQHTLGQARFDKMYRAQPLLDAGAIVTFSSDIVSQYEWKTKRANPYFGMQIGNTRIEPELGETAALRLPVTEQLSIKDLIYGYTINGAHQLRMSEMLGSIEVGKAADLVILNQDLFETPKHEIGNIVPNAVIMDGELISGSLSWK
ncbi:MAG: amidohydrolase [Woeseiaceae bacterium]|nr:amidohydrolase [Woeseiaceae bacterium]